MPRPTKFRTVEFFPKDTYFVPFNKPQCKIEEVNLKIEELEAIRLKDIEGFNQEECSKRMNISRQTFKNVIDNARKVIEISLTQGKAIKICGGNYTTKNCELKCHDCGKIYQVKQEYDHFVCPGCSSEKIGCRKPNENYEKWGRGIRYV